MHLLWHVINADIWGKSKNKNKEKNRIRKYCVWQNIIIIATNAVKFKIKTLK